MSLGCRHRRIDGDAAFRPFGGQVGFTLIEMMVALAVMALIGGLAMPRLGQFVDRLTFTMRRTNVERQLANLGRRAVYEGRDLDLTSWPPPQANADGTPVTPESEQLINLPSDWKIVINGAIHYRFDGVCDGGTLNLVVGQDTYTYTLTAPLCYPVLS